ncbi:DUF3558 domain-containing protein [Streptomyces flaveus]|uniref:DUF3558 domain-containing protein n=1 Tax=Streptomyces flaveus TaxID=66370 RepID=UPI00332E8E98
MLQKLHGSPSKCIPTTTNVPPRTARPAHLAFSCAVAACLVLAGSSCSKPEQSPQSAGARHSTGAPRIDNPLATEGMMSYPCSALTDAQAIDAGMPSDVEHRELFDANGVACLWEYERSATGVGMLTVAWPSDTPGLDALYARRSEQKYFEETTMRGYPAVFANEEDWRAEGHCVLYVGVSDASAFYTAVDTNGEDGLPRPCDAARRAASTVVENLRAN